MTHHHTDSQFWAVATPTRNQADAEVMDARLHEAAGMNGLTEVIAELFDKDEATAACRDRHPAGKDRSLEINCSWKLDDGDVVGERGPETVVKQDRTTSGQWAAYATNAHKAIKNRGATLRRQACIISACLDLADQWDNEAEWWEGSPALGQSMDPAKAARGYAKALRDTLATQ